MIRFLLWALLFFIVYRIIRSLSSSGFGGWSKGERTPTGNAESSFKEIEEAKFEDLTDDEKPKQ